MALVLSVNVRRALWWLILVLSCTNATMLLLWARIYYQNETRDSLLWVIRVYYLYYDGNSFLIRSSHLIATGYAILAVSFACVGLKLVVYTLMNRSLRFGAVTTRITRRLSSVVVSATSRKPFHLAHAPPLWQRIKAMSQYVYQAFGIHGQYFEARLLLDEVIELTTQTIAAHSSSQSISNVWLNQSFGIIIFLNCISSLIFHRIFRHSAVKQRVACLISDVVLDFAWGVLLPVWSAMPLLRMYKRIHDLGVTIDYTVNSTREVERVLMLSWGSYLLSVIPLCASFMSTLELLSILQEIVPVAPTRVAPSRPSTSTATKFRIAPVKPWLKRLSSALHTLMACYGISILVITLAANHFITSVDVHDEYECLHRMNPWLSTKEACIGRKISCSSLGISGSRVEIEQALEVFDPSTLSDLFITNCSSLQIPSRIQQFPRLQSLGIKHSVIVGWEDDAALTGTQFLDLKTLNLNNLSFLTGADLSGLLNHEITSSMEWIHLSNIDEAAGRLLGPLQARGMWRDVIYFDCDVCRLTTFPEIVLNMHQLVALSLVGNDLETVSGMWGCSEDLELQAVWLDGNPRLRELPDCLWHATKTCEVVSMTSTNLSILPTWLPQEAVAGFKIAAAGTPLCDSTTPVELSADLGPLLSCDVAE